MTDILYIGTQAIGACATIAMFLSYQRPKKRQIVLLQIISIFLFTVHYSMLGGWTGVAMNAISLSKTVLYYFEEKSWFKNKLFTVIYAVVIVVVGAVTWVDMFSVFPIVAMLINAFAYNIKVEKWFRIGMFPCSPLWFIYALYGGSWPAMIGEILTTSSLLSAIIRYDILKKTKEENKPQ